MSLRFPWQRKPENPAASFESSMAKELEFHLAQATEDYIAQGLSPEEARLRARREFGAVDLAKEELRDTRHFRRWLDDLFLDVRYALRGFRRTPGFTATAIAVLALGIGANTAVFTLLNRVLLAALPVDRPNELVEASCVQALDPKDVACLYSYPGYRMMAEQSKLTEGIAAFGRIGDINVVNDGAGEVATGVVASGNYFQVLGVPAAVGRVFGPADDSPSAAPVAVLSHGYWQRRFGSDPAVIGRIVSIKNKPVTLIGVTPPAFRGLALDLTPDLTMPFAPITEQLQRPGYLAQRANWWLRIILRQRPGTQLAALEAALAPVYTRTVEDMIDGMGRSTPPRLSATLRRFQLRLHPATTGMESELRRDLNQPLRILMGAVTLVLLIACANLAGLLLSRCVLRRREFAVRLAIGAGRARIVRQVLTESLLLSLFGAAAGLVLAVWSGNVLLHLAAGERAARAVNTAPDLSVLAFSATAALACALLVGLIPAIRFSMSDAQGGLREVRADRTGSRWSRLLIPVQAALTSILLAGAVLFLLTFDHFQRVDLGYRADQLLSFRVVPELIGQNAASSAGYYDRLLLRLRALPGVAELTTSASAPGQLGNRSIVTTPGFTPRRLNDQIVSRNWVGANYVQATGMRLLAGRDLTEDDQRAESQSAIVNNAFAQHFFGDGPALGKQFTAGQRSHVITGIVADSRDRGPKAVFEPTIYVPIGQAATTSNGAARTITLRAHSLAPGLVAAVNAVLREVDPQMPVIQMQTGQAVVEQYLARERLLATLGTVFSGLALLLVAVGLYGLISGTVAARTRELGIRMALGARPGEAAWLVTRESIVLVTAGTAIGLAAGAFLTRFLSSQIHGVGAADPAPYALTAAALTGVTALAAYLPARRATAIDPAITLRSE